MNELRSAFPGQADDEPVFIFLRRYYLAFLPFLGGILAMLFVSLAIFTFAITQLSTDTANDFYNWIVLLGGLMSLFTVVFGTVAWFDFYFDVHVVTDRRVIDINQNRLFSREISELSLEDVEDVSVEHQGILSTLFNYGEIIIQTAGTRNNFMFPNIANPRAVASIVVDLAEQAKRGVSQSDRFPTSQPKGVINNKIITDRQGLIKEGALRASEKLNTPVVPSDIKNV